MEIESSNERDVHLPALEKESMAICDVDVVSLAMAGDKEAFSALFRATYARMYHVAQGILHRDDDVRDALQIGYTKAYRYLPRLSSPEMFYPWLKKTIENSALDVFKDLKAHNVQGIDPDLAAAQTESNIERRADIHDILTRMDPRRAELLVMYYYDGLKLSEIAKRLGEPASTVRSRFKAAKKEILSLLRTKGIDSSMYGGSVSAMIATSLRMLIGTDLLSAAIAQQILDSVLNGNENPKISSAVVQIVEKKRNQTVLRAVSLLMALCVMVAAATTFTVLIVKSAINPSSPVGEGGQVSVQTGTSSDNQSFFQNEGVTQLNGSSALSDGAFSSGVNNIATSDIPSENKGAASPSSDFQTSSVSNSGTQSFVEGIPLPPVQEPIPEPEIVTQDLEHYYSVNETGRVRTRNVDHEAGYTCRQDDTIYYFGETSSYKMKLDGSGKTAINGITRKNLPFVIGDYIYYGTQSSYHMDIDFVYESLNRTNIATGQSEKLFGGSVYDASAEFILHFTGWKGKLVFCTGTRYVGNPQGQLRFYSYDPTTEKLTMLKEHNPEISMAQQADNYYHEIFVCKNIPCFYEGEFLIMYNLYSAETGEMTFEELEKGNMNYWGYIHTFRSPSIMFMTTKGIAFSLDYFEFYLDFPWMSSRLSGYDTGTPYLYDYANNTIYYYNHWKDKSSNAPDIVAYSEGVAYDSYPDGLIFKLDKRGILMKTKSNGTNLNIYIPS